MSPQTATLKVRLADMEPVLKVLRQAADLAEVVEGAANSLEVSDPVLAEELCDAVADFRAAVAAQAEVESRE